MNRWWLAVPGVLCLAAFAGGPAYAGEKDEGVCSFGTTIDFVDTPKEAADLAKKDGRLVFVLHVSGNFEDPRFT
jgi:hypothetical protein